MTIEKKGVSFIGAMTLMFTLIIFQDFFISNIESRQMFMLFVYIFIALASENYKGILRLVERLWLINGNGDAEREKFLLIKSFLEINVTRWNRYWRLYENIVNGEKTSLWKIYIQKITKGSIDLKQFLWIFGYIVYCVFIPDPILKDALNFIIDLCSLGFFLFTGSKVIGLGAFMGNIFEAIKIGKEDHIKQCLKLLESQIIYGAVNFAYLKSKIK